MFLAESTQCMAVLSNYSKAIIDPSLPLHSEDLVKLVYHHTEDQMPIVFNKDYRADLQARINDFYAVYHTVLGEVIQFLQPDLLLNIHTHRVKSIKDTTQQRLEDDMIIYMPDIYS